MNIEEYKEIVAEEANQTAEEKTSATKVELVEQETQPEPTIETIDVNGEQLTIEELTKGYLRQSDYTKKTTEVSTQKQELADAVAMYEMIQKNPKLREQLQNAGGDVKMLKRATSEHKRISELEGKIAGMELDKNISELKAKYPDFDETKVLNEAAKRRMTDLEFIYKATRDIQGGEEKVDEAKLKETLLTELKAELGVGDTKPTTIISGRVSGGAPSADSDGPTMTPSERRAAKAFGMTDEEYIRNRDM